MCRASRRDCRASASLAGINADKATVELLKRFAGLYDAKLATTGFSIDGGAGTDTMLLTIVGNLDASVKNVTSVENVTIATGAAAPTLVSIDATKFVGATTISTASTGNVTVFGLGAGQSGGVLGLDPANGARFAANGVSTFVYAMASRPARSSWRAALRQAASG